MWGINYLEISRAFDEDSPNIPANRTEKYYLVSIATGCISCWLNYHTVKEHLLILLRSEGRKGCTTCGCNADFKNMWDEVLVPTLTWLAFWASPSGLWWPVAPLQWDPHHICSANSWHQLSAQLANWTALSDSAHSARVSIELILLWL